MKTKALVPSCSSTQSTFRFLSSGICAGWTALLLLFATSGCNKQADLEETRETTDEKSPTANRLQLSSTQIQNIGIQKTVSKVASYTSTIEVHGRVLPNANARFDITSPTTGKLSIENERWPMPGTFVTKGQKLASVKVRVSPDLRSDFENRVTEAGARLKHNANVVESLTNIRDGLERISTKEVISRTELDTANANLSKAKAQVSLDTAIVESWRGVLNAIDSEDNAKQSMWQLPILAPHNGIVADVAAANGAYVESGTPLLSIVDQSQQLIQLSIQANNPWLSDKAKSSAPIVVTIYGKSFDATYIGMASTIDLSGQRFQLLYSIQSDVDELRPGLLVTAKYPTGNLIDDAIEIPTSSVLKHKGLNYVYVAVEDDRFERRSIQILGTEADSTFVRPMNEVQEDLNIGVMKGEQIVTSGAQVLLSREFLAEGGDDD
jgi:membrane fusion protein, heavy metal efflux system